MSNTNRPAVDCDHVSRCTGCGCSECGALDAGPLAPLALPSGRVVQACAGCRGVPEMVEDKETVRERTTWDREALALVKVETAVA